MSSSTASGISLFKKLTQQSVGQYGAIGDGVTNETTLFTALDNQTDVTFDLLGLTFLVDAHPKGNYINGEFKVGLQRYKKAKNESNEYNKAQFNLKRDYVDSRHVGDVVLALAKGTVILGDSISHGAYQGALYDNGWVNLFKRMVNAENGYGANGSYGLIPLLSWNQVENNYTVDLASVAFIGAPVAVFNVEGEDLLNALAFEITPNASVKSTLPTFQANVRIWYVQHLAGGTLEVLVNGSVVATQSTLGALDLAASITVPMTDNGLGTHVIEVRGSVGTVIFSGFGYENQANAVNNFSQSGRKLIDATEKGLKQLCTTGNLVMSLGHNDVALAEGNQVDADKFTANINHIIKWCNHYNTNVIVPDFCWLSDENTHVRKELKRLAKETSGTYIDFPSLLTRDYRNRVEFSESFYLVSTLRMWHDASHPNELGGQWIAETIAKAIGLGCNTKKEALDFYDFWMPLQLDGTELKNRFATVPNLTAIRRNGNEYQYNIRATKLVGGGGIAIGTYTLNITGNLPVIETSNNNNYGLATLNTINGVHVSDYQIDQQGVIKLHVDSVFQDHLEFSFSRMVL